MKIGMIKNATAIIGRSQGYQGLPILAEIIIDPATGKEAPQFTSEWIPSPEDILAIMGGAPIRVKCLNAQPPILVEVGDSRYEPELQ